MTKEYESNMKNYVWEFIPGPQGKSIMTSKWLFKIKHGIDGCIEKYKERFMARVFSQKEGIYYEEFFLCFSLYHQSLYYFFSCKSKVDFPSNGCQDNFFPWFSSRGSIC